MNQKVLGPARLAATDDRSAACDADAEQQKCAPVVLDTDDIPFRVTSFAIQLWDGGNNAAPETCSVIELRWFKSGKTKDDLGKRTRRKPTIRAILEAKKPTGNGPCIYDTLGGISFRISHSAFFQALTPAHAKPQVANV